MRGALISAFLLAPALALAAPSEIHINQDGKITAKNVVVMQKSENGTTLFSRVAWGDIFLRMTVLTTPNGSAAKIIKNNGGAATYADVQVGDILSVEGTLSPNADSLLINATNIKDLSLNKEPKTFSGVVKSVDYSGSFVLPDKKLGPVKVLVDSNTTVTKGVRTIALGEVAAGDKILSTAGTYDFELKTLMATTVTVYQNKAVFNPKNFEGSLKSISGMTLPVTAVVTVGKSDYTVYFADTAKVMSKNRTATTLQRFTAGDKVRFYGAIRQTNLFEIDADSIRNLNF